MQRPRRALAAAVLVAVTAACGSPDVNDDVTTADASPLDETPLDEAPLDEAPVDEANVDDAPVEEAPLQQDLPALAATSGRQRAQLRVDGRTRTYEAVVPEAALDGPVPLVLAFHGFGQMAGPFLDLTGLDDTAASAGWVVVAPDGVDRSFNAGGGDSGCCGSALEQDVDDVALARALVAEVEATLGHAPSAVVSTGFSNGGMMSHRLGCEAADLLDGVVAASGALFVADCDPSRPVEVRHVHGSSDLVVPQSRGAQAADTWSQLLDCSASETDDDATDALEGTAWTACDGDVQVTFLLRRRAGHDWLRGAPLDTNQVIAEVVDRVLGADGRGSS